MSSLFAIVSTIAFPCIFVWEAFASLLRLRPCCTVTSTLGIVFLLCSLGGNAPAAASVGTSPMGDAHYEPPSLTMRSYPSNGTTSATATAIATAALSTSSAASRAASGSAHSERDFGTRRRGRRGGRRRDGEEDGRGRPTAVTASGANDATPSSNHGGGAAVPAAFRGLRPLSPLPLPYLQHLAYMKSHPHNRPDYQGQGSARRGAWMTVVPGYERGLASRDTELQAIQHQSGWDPADSPAVQLPPPATVAESQTEAPSRSSSSSSSSCSFSFSFSFAAAAAAFSFAAAAFSFSSAAALAAFSFAAAAFTSLSL
jgi:hypothetical protein